MAYLYEMHLHSMEGSACGKVSAREYVKAYKDAGYAGIFITDHFYNGNCRPDRDLPWEEWVNQFCSGYEAAKEEGDKQGLQVFFALEERFSRDDNNNMDEWLIYGLDKKYLLAHPEMRNWTRAEYLKNVHEAGGCCVQAHPFRDRKYIDSFHITLGVDAIEGYNSCNLLEANVMANLYAQKHDMLMIGGSDVHFVDHVPHEKLSGLSFEKPLESALDLAQAIRERRDFTVRKPEGYPDMSTPVPPFVKPVYIYDEQGNPTDLPSDILF